MKRKGMILFVFTLIFMINCPVYASEEIKYLDEAKVLKALSIFNGTDQGFELEKYSDRVQAAVIFTNFIGKTEEAKKENNKHNFTDLSDYSWADTQIGYLYKHGYTNGIGNGEYGTGRIGPNELATFLLKSLGYTLEDFQWDKALEKMKELEIIDNADYDEFLNTEFNRDKVVHMCYKALTAKLKNSDKIILEKLLKEGAITSEQIKNTNDDNILKYFQKNFSGNIEAVADGTEVSSYEQYRNVILNAYETLQTEINIKIKNFNPNTYSADLDKLNLGFIQRISISWIEYPSYADMNLKIVYRQGSKLLKALENDTARQRLNSKEMTALNKAEQIIASVIKEDMTPYEKELAIHDYLVLNCEYDEENYRRNTLSEDSYTPYGLLVNGKGVCEAYTDSFTLLLAMVGIDSQRVLGSGNGGAHAWNIVKLEDEYYMVDVTWDDPIPDVKNKVRYNYFNITSDELSKDHVWDFSQYPTANGKKYNYYSYNNMTVESYEEFKNIILEKLADGEKNIKLYIKNFNSNIYGNLSFTNRGYSYTYSTVNGNALMEIDFK